MQWCGSFKPNERNNEANKTKKNERSKRKGIYHCHTARKRYMFPSCLSLTKLKISHSVVPNAKHSISIQGENVSEKYCLRSIRDYIKVLYSVKKRLFHVYFTSSEPNSKLQEPTRFLRLGKNNLEIKIFLFILPRRSQILTSQSLWEKTERILQPQVRFWARSLWVTHVVPNFYRWKPN